jgi:rod shape-determining protein MreD
MLLWTGLFLVFDLIDSRLGFRDYLTDWVIAAAAIAGVHAGAWYVGVLLGADTSIAIVLPQMALGALAYPIVARIVIGLDRWRLGR